MQLIFVGRTFNFAFSFCAMIFAFSFQCLRKKNTITTITTIQRQVLFWCMLNKIKYVHITNLIANQNMQTQNVESDRCIFRWLIMWRHISPTFEIQKLTFIAWISWDLNSSNKKYNKNMVNVKNHNETNKIRNSECFICYMLLNYPWIR